MDKTKRLAFTVVSLSIMILAVLPAIHVTHAQTFTEVGSLTFLHVGVGVGTAVIDPTHGFAYFGSSVVVKVRLSDFTEVGNLTLSPFQDLQASVIDPAAGFACFLTIGDVFVKVRLSDFSEVASLALKPGAQFGGPFDSSVIDTVRGFAYVTMSNSTGAFIVKIRLSDLTPVGALALNPQLFFPPPTFPASVIDPTAGFAYFGTGTTNPPVIVKVRLSDLTLNATLAFKTGEGSLRTAVIDPANGFAYFATLQGAGAVGGVVVKVRLSDFTEVGSVILNEGENIVGSSVIDSAAGFAYFGTLQGAVVKVRLSDLTRIEALTLNTGGGFAQGNSMAASVIDSAAGFAYFGTSGGPPIVFKVELVPDFTIAVRLSSLSISTGISGTLPITITPFNGFTGTINLSVSSASALSCTLDHATVQSSGSPSIVNLSCVANNAGDYIVTLTATGGPAPKSTSVTVHVVSTSPSSTPNAPPTIFGLSPTLFYGAAGGTVALIAIASVAVALRRRKQQAPPSP